MEKFITKNWALIGWGLSIALDQQFKIVENLVHNEDVVKLIYGIGSLVLAKFWNTNNNRSVTSRLAEDDGAVTPGKGF